jgi:anti-sigma B factor antagonist
MTGKDDVPPVFSVDIAQNKTSTVVSFWGELDVMTALDIRDAFFEPRVVSAPHVTVDLTQATFLDSTAMGLIVAGCRRIRREGAAFSVTCGGGMVRRVLEVSGLIEFLEVETPR